MKNHLCIFFLIGFFASFIELNAQATIVEQLSNFDVRNTTGKDANDFHLKIIGVWKEQVTGTFDDGYGTPTIESGIVAPYTTVSWSGGTTLAGATSHFGVSLAGGAKPTSYVQTWTFEGAEIGEIPDAVQLWEQTDDGINRDIITNRSTETVWIQRRQMQVDGWVELADLTRDSTYFLDAALIDIEMVPLALSSTVTWDFFLPTPATTQWTDILAYELFTEDPRLAGPDGWSVTYINALRKEIPEPQSIGFLWLPLIGLGLILRRGGRK